MMNVMLDLETMGNNTNSPIIAIGAVIFNKSGVIDYFHTPIDLQSSIDSGATLDASTIIWWMQQSDEAKRVFGENSENEKEALLTFSKFFPAEDDARLWGNGAAFDNAILSSAYRRNKLDQPWAFWNDRCYRTVKNMAKDIPLSVRTGVHHNALDDAISQADHLIRICKEKDWEP